MIAIQSQSASLALPAAPARAPATETLIPSDVPKQRMHDASRFPLVRLRTRAVQPGYAFAWGAEMQRLLALKAPFVIVAHYSADEPADDLRVRSAWLRSNRVALAAYCRGLIVIEPRIEARASTREAVRGMCEGSGVRMVVVSGMRVANELAPVLLKHSGTDLSKPSSISESRRQMP
ncbi:hypothetical protein [Caballeronia sordidicola]|nr:hypothetical protein [Caballeronia sordidicola]